MSVIYRAFTGFAAISAAAAAAVDVAAYAASGGVTGPTRPECPHCECQKKSAPSTTPAQLSGVEAEAAAPTAVPTEAESADNPDFTFAEPDQPVESA